MSRHSKIEVNMFPFLSVLCCVIGVLILFILMIIGTRIVTADPVADMSAIYAESNLDLSEEECTVLEAEIDRLGTLLVERRQALDQLHNQRDRLRELLSLKQDERELTAGAGLLFGAEIGLPQHVQMVPIDNELITKKPQFIVVDSNGYRLKPQNERFAMSDLAKFTDSRSVKQHSPTKPFEKYLEQIERKKADLYLVFLIRPDGAQAFKKLREYLLNLYPHPRYRGKLSSIDIGWEPFEVEWSLAEEE